MNEPSTSNGNPQAGNAQASSPQREPSGEILCIGEVLWDALPEGLFLGGALFNVACHLHTLGVNVTLVSRIGADALGREVLRRMRARDMKIDLVQKDPNLQTGFVEVSLRDDGVAEYVIVEPVAWDAIAWSPDLAERARSARAVVFGSLAQRSQTSRHTIQRLCDDTRGTKVFDVNLRPPYTARSVVEASLRTADVVKLNDEELTQMRGWFELPPDMAEAVEYLVERFDLHACCVTRGEEGSGLWRDGTWVEHPGHDVAVKDTVGAGDAFLAALLAGLLASDDTEHILARANRLGAYVASRSGATPAYDVATLDDISALPLSSGPATP